MRFGGSNDSTSFGFSQFILCEPSFIRGKVKDPSPQLELTTVPFSYRTSNSGLTTSILLGQ